MGGKAKALALITLAYVICIGVGVAVLALGELPAPWNAFVADVAATLAIFGFSWRYRNSSFYDAYWSVIPPLIAVYWYCANEAAGVNGVRAALVIGLVWIWAIRLTANWATYWGGLHHEDWRYGLVRGRVHKSAALWVDLFGIHLFPTVQVFLGCLPIYAVMTLGHAPIGWLDVLATFVTLGAILIETIADLQLHAFTPSRKNGSFIQSGLWSWSRHPNYFGELMFWWGLMLFGIASAPAQWWWITPGALAMTAMFWFASIPLMDRRSIERREGYSQYMKLVSGLVPMRPRRIGPL